MKAAGSFPASDPDDHWWIPAGRVFFSPGSNDSAARELSHAHAHFFLPSRFRDPFHTAAVSTESSVRYDAYDLLTVETRDAIGNRVTVDERLSGGSIAPGNDYRVLQPARVMDPNRTRIAFDALGMVVGTAVMGKPEETRGDSLDGLQADLSETTALAHLDKPLSDPHNLLGRATTRLVYDLFSYRRSRDRPDPQPAVVTTLARETHDADQYGEPTRIQHSFSYSDGFGREIQKKTQAERGRVPRRDARGRIVVGADGQPEMTPGDVSPRWVGSGWTVFNNKGNPVRRYEPFFSDTHRFEFDARVGFSAVLFYDPAERVVATLHPDHTYDKVVFDPWRQVTHDVNDTCAARGVQTGDPRTDPDVAGYVRAYFKTRPAGWQTWHQKRIGGGEGVREQKAAQAAARHADTPSTAHLDSLGRPFLTLADNGPDPSQPGKNLLFATRVELDVEGNELRVVDAMGRIVMRYAYSMAGSEEAEDGEEEEEVPAHRIHQASMEAGERWMLNDAASEPLRAWDSRGYGFRTEYDPLCRPLRSFVTGADPADPGKELLAERLVYGDQHPEAEARNLRGTLYLHLDPAGALTTGANDFKGNPLRGSRRLASEYKRTVHWGTVDAALPASATAPLSPAALKAALAPLLEPENSAYTSRTTYDALDRPLTLTTPHTAAMKPSVVRPGYNEASLLERVDVNLHGATAGGQPVWTTFVQGIDYDARGQRRRIDYGNSVATSYSYDPLTLRLVHLSTRRNAVAFPDDFPPTPTPAGRAARCRACATPTIRRATSPTSATTPSRRSSSRTGASSRAPSTPTTPSTG